MNSHSPDTMIRGTLLNKRVFSALNEDVDFTAHNHDYFEIVITIENNFIHTVNGKSFRPKNGDIVILRPSDVHSAKPLDEERPRKLRDIYVSRELMEETCNSLSPALYEQIIDSPPENPPQFNMPPNRVQGLNDLLKFPFFINIDTVNTTDTERLEIIKKSITAEILGAYVYENFRNETKMPECIVRLLSALQNPQFAKLKIGTMATELGYSQKYLNKRFKAYFGKTIEKYLIDSRVDKSIPLLLQTDMTTEKIALSLGWNNANNYTIAFKRLYGIPPLRYRTKYKLKGDKV